MASSPNFTPVDSDGGRKAAGAGIRGLDNRFEWVASSPSPAEIEALERRFPEVIQVPTQILEAETSEWRLKAVIARSLSRWVPAEAIVREFRRAGFNGDVEAVSLAHRHYIFRFSELSAKEMVLARPWMANGQLIAMEDWRPQFVPTEDSVASALIWIRLPSLPIEYWSEEIISSIVSVAGDFLFVDEATRARKRGGFARACVRVDLSKPLRPGARVRGSAMPFWQQLVYEHLEGICTVCGSVHPSGACSSPPPEASSSDCLQYGPWMAALRRRRSPPTQTVASKSMNQQASAGSSGEWQIPKKTARRSRFPVVAEEGGRCAEVQTGFGSRGVNRGDPQGSVNARSDAGLNKRATALTESKQAVPCSPVTGPVPGTGDSEAGNADLLKLKQKAVCAVNPFALLGSDKSSGRPRNRNEANPGPLKRARPVDSPAPRVVSNNRKGKGKIPGKREVQSSVSSPLPLATLKGSETFLGFGSLTNRPTEVMDSVGPLDAPQMMQEEGLSHDSVVSLLKKAMEPDAKAGVMVTPDQCPLEGVTPVTCSPMSEMLGEEGGPLHSE